MFRASRLAQTRMRRIHHVIQSGEFPNASSLAKELEVGIKTIYRDVEYMRSNMGLPIAYDSQRFGYYFTEPVVDFPVVWMTDAELFALLVAREAMAQYEGTPFCSPMDAMLRRLAISAPDAGANEVSNLFSFRPFAPEKLDPVLFEALTRVARQRRTIAFTYRKVGAAAEEQRTVHPYHLTCSANFWYLIAFDPNRGGMRTFALSRIRKLKVTSERFQVRDSFDADTYLHSSFNVFKGEDDYEVVIDFDAWAADLVRGRKWHSSQEITELPKGAIRFRMRVDSLKEVERWVLNWGTHATVVRPAALCNRIHEVCTELAARYLDQLKEEAERPAPARHEMYFGI